jgi:hypothetical protein
MVVGKLARSIGIRCRGDVVHHYLDVSMYSRIVKTREYTRIVNAQSFQCLSAGHS